MKKPEPLITQLNPAKGWNPVDVFSKKSYNRKDIHKARRYIEEQLMDQMKPLDAQNVDCYRNSDLDLAIGLYDELFLGNSVKKYTLKNYDVKGEFIESFPDRAAESRLGQPTIIVVAKANLREAFQKHSKESANRICKNRLDCLLSILEHELTHVLIWLYKSSDYKVDPSGHTPTFEAISRNIFDHKNVMVYLGHGIELYNDRPVIIGKALKKGQEITDVRGQKYIVQSVPKKLNNETKVRVRSQYLGQLDLDINAIRTPEKAKKAKEKALREEEELLLSPKGKGKEKVLSPKKKSPVKTNKYPRGLTWNTFRSEAAVRGVRGKDVSIQYNLYKLGKI